MFLGDRSRNGIYASSGDILEANLEESLPLDDLELDEGGGELHLMVEDDEFIFLDE